MGWRELAGVELDSSLEVVFSRSEPPDLEPYRQAFGVALRFNCEQTAVFLPLSLLNQPIVGANAASRIALETHVRALWHAGTFDLVTQLRRALRVGLLTGNVGAKEIATQLSFERKTLDRRLRGEGVAFREILEETRLELVKQLLQNTRLSIGEIATVVGYASPGVLTRAFIRWTGIVPSIWRERVVGTT